jgi:hypothetical protein
MGLFDGIVFKKADDWIFTPLAVSQTPDRLEAVPVPPNTAYLSVFLRSMRICDVRKGLSHFYGTVHSHISVPHVEKHVIEMDVVSTPGRLRGLKPDDTVDMVAFDQRLFGPVPYRGGDLNFQIGLFSIKGADLTAPYLEVLESMSRAAGVSWWQVARPFVEPLKSGIDLLVGAQGGSSLEVGAYGTWPTPSTGYHLALRAGKGSVDVARLKLGPDYKLLDASGAPYTAHPYLVLAVTMDEVRPDWFGIPDVSAAYSDLQREARKGDVNAAEQAFQVFRRVVLTSPDLVFQHAKALVREVDDMLKQVLPTVGTGAALAPPLMPDLTRLSPRWQQ